MSTTKRTICIYHSKKFPMEVISENNLNFIFENPSFGLEFGSIVAESIDEVKIFGFVPNDQLRQKVFSVLKTKGKVLINNAVNDREEGQNAVLDLQISGFVDVMAAKEVGEVNERFVVGEKPSWSLGVSAPLTVNKDSTAWKISTIDLAEEDLVDENELLNDNIEVPSASCGDETSTGKKRACKNCTCGLAEQEQLEAGAPVSTEDKIVKASSCGNCAKGDAFRCAGCPFLGKPAFEPGMERVVLAMGDDF
eukprot:gene4594-9128_t